MHHEYICLITAENIKVAYQSKKQSDDLVQWTIDNPSLAAILAEATKIYADSIQHERD
jgi:hypothetical protein